MCNLFLFVALGMQNALSDPDVHCVSDPFLECSMRNVFMVPGFVALGMQRVHCVSDPPLGCKPQGGGGGGEKHQCACCIPRATNRGIRNTVCMLHSKSY